MGVYINMEMPSNEPMLVKINPDGSVSTTAKNGYKKYEAISIPEPHGRLIDADEFLKRAIDTKCFRGDYALMLEELVEESTTIIPADPAEEGE